MTRTKNARLWGVVASILLVTSIVFAGSSFSEAHDRERVPSQPRPGNVAMAQGSNDLAWQLAEAISVSALRPRILQATYEGVSEQAAVFTDPLQEFPRRGAQYAVLSTGPAADIPGVATTFSSVDMGGVHIPSGSPDGLDAYDVATLTVTLDLADLPLDPEPRLVFRFKFLSEEPPTFWGSIYQDYFTAYLRDSEGQVIDNIARLPDGQPFTIDNARPWMNQVTGTSTDPLPPYPSPNDTVFNAATGIHTTHFDLTPWVGQEIELEFQIGDVGDAIYDSVVFIDGLEIQAGPLPNFFVERVEFNQASQFEPGPGGVAAEQLVSGTRWGTVVRVYVVGEDNEEDPKAVSAALHVYKDGSPIDGSPFAPFPKRIRPVLSPSRTARDADDRPTQTLDFWIPRPATEESGEYEFYVMVDPDHEVDEADKTNNRFPATGMNAVTFHDRELLKVLLIRVTTVDGDGQVVNEFDDDDWDNYYEDLSFARRVLPRGVRFWWTSMEWDLDATRGWGWWEKNVGDLSTRDGRDELFSTILDIMEGATRDYHTVVAMLPRDTDLFEGALGWGFIGAPGSIVRTTAHPGVLAHEVGHNWLPWGAFGPDGNHDPTNSAEDGLWPSPRPVLMLNNTNFLHAFASLDPWVSPRTYQALFENFELGNPAHSESYVTSQQALEALRITGWVAEDDELIVRPIHTIEADTFTMDDPTGDYLMELRNENDEVLDSRQFSPPRITESGYDDPPETGPFGLVVPRPEGLVSIVFKSLGGSSILGTVPVSEEPPTVSVLSPSGGENISGTFSVEWEGSHPEEFDLFYTVHYSPDGEEYQVLATLLTETSFEWDTTEVPGGTNAVMRVIATDGVNTASDESEPFTVQTKPPAAFILSPGEGTAIPIGDVTTFEGEAHDLEDGELTGDQLEWFSDIDGILGTGETISTTEVSAGIHTITLTATDSDGNTGTDSISFSVVDTTPPPPTNLQSTPGDQQVALHWEASTGEFVAGYRVYWGMSSGVYGDDFDVGDATSHTVVNLINETTYYFAVTAYDAVGNESEFSNEVQATPSLEEITKAVETATGTGTAYFTPSHGVIENLEALPVPPGAPTGVTFPHGMFSFEITGLDDGETVTLTIEFPEPGVEPNFVWWKYDEAADEWHDLPITRVDDHTIELALTDGVYPGDLSGAADGTIVDPGGPGNPEPPPVIPVGGTGYLVNRLALLAPWLALAAAIAGAITFSRRRRAQS